MITCFTPFNTAIETIKKRKLEQANSRSRRNVQRVNYSGMDMNSDDEGTVSICKTKWNNGVPSYSWVKYPAAQADDEWGRPPSHRDDSILDSATICMCKRPIVKYPLAYV